MLISLTTEPTNWIILAGSTSLGEFPPSPPCPPQGTHKGCPYNGTHQLARAVRTIVGASLVGALGGDGGKVGTPPKGCRAYYPLLLCSCQERSILSGNPAGYLHAQAAGAG